MSSAEMVRASIVTILELPCVFLGIFAWFCSEMVVVIYASCEP